MISSEGGDARCFCLLSTRIDPTNAHWPLTSEHFDSAFAFAAIEALVVEIDSLNGSTLAGDVDNTELSETSNGVFLTLTSIC